MHLRCVAAAFAAGLAAAATLPAQSSVPSSRAPTCAETEGARAPSQDLYCIELLPAEGFEAAAGVVRLLPPPSPFGVAVAPGGEQLYDLAFELSGLPDPATLGPYTTFVAWATTPQLAPVVRLGEVLNGATRPSGARVQFDRFIVMITAEASAGVPEREGPLVLRGTSASMRMQPHDIAYVLAGFLERADTGAAPVHAHDDPGHARPPGADTGWVSPPMHPDVAMPPALMTLRPDVAPYLPADSGNVPLARPRELLRLADGDSLVLVAGRVRRVLFGRTVTMLGFNGQYPGPLLHVDEGATIVVRFENRTDFPTAVHWHGLRLDNRFDGVPHVTQEPVPPGGRFEYHVHFPDAGIYWYHPHHREDVLQGLGLYGNLLVNSRDPAFYGPANREEILMLDDILIGEAGLVPFGREQPTHALMGRFGNVLLVNGEPRWQVAVRRGEVVRLFLTNVSSTRVFNLSFQGSARMKVVASDLGRYAREQWVGNVTIAPAERYVVDVRFEQPGDVALVNRVRAIDHILARFFEELDTLGVVRVSAERAHPDHGAGFAQLRRASEVAAEIERYRPHFERPADHELVVTVQANDLPFPIGPLLNFESVYRNPVEWSGTMPEMDWVATGRSVRWILREPSTGRENMDVRWRFRVGDVVRLRLVNDRGALHAMQHPIHIHGQRFLVLSVNGVPNEHLVWKDTALLPTGFVAELLLEITNPGRWMLHCHVSEHLETGMHMVFDVEHAGLPP